MNEILLFLEKTWPSIITVVIIFLTLIIVFNMIGINFSPIQDKHIQKVVTIESFESKADTETISKVYKNNPSVLHSTCKTNSKNSCAISSYCVLLNGKTCVGGNENGPTYLTNEGNKVDYNYYIHKMKYHGKK
jgi:hypothetical protein